MNTFKYAAIIAVVVISGVIGFMSMKNNSQKTELSGLALANVEALTQGEVTSMLIACDSYSLIIICKIQCSKCDLTHEAIKGYGRCQGLKGTCKCGKVYQ